MPWLRAPREQLAGLVAAGRCPHALLLHGPQGTGRRHLALWLAQAQLEFDIDRVAAEIEGTDSGHPDLYIVEPAADKNTISIDQIRELIDFLALTSHGSTGRTAIIWPAEAMTINAANSLLKTLEEPPGNATVVLVSESVSRLPATIVSRCQRFRLPVPDREVALGWLQQQVSADLHELLDFAGGAPLAALALHEEDFGAVAREFADDLDNLEARRVSPASVAERWVKHGDRSLQWLYWRIAERIRVSLTAAKESPQCSSSGASVAAGFRQMNQIRELRRLFKGGINAELSIAGLLMDWYGGLGRN